MTRFAKLLRFLWYCLHSHCSKFWSHCNLRKVLPPHSLILGIMEFKYLDSIIKHLELYRKGKKKDIDLREELLEWSHFLARI